MKTWNCPGQKYGRIVKYCIRRIHLHMQGATQDGRCSNTNRYSKRFYRVIYKVLNDFFPILWWEYVMWQSNAMVLCKYLYQMTWADLIKSSDALNTQDIQHCWYCWYQRYQTADACMIKVQHLPIQLRYSVEVVSAWYTITFGRCCADSIKAERCRNADSKQRVQSCCKMIMHWKKSRLLGIKYQS